MMAHYTKDIFIKISIMEKARKHGNLEIHMKVTIKMVIYTVMGNLFGLKRKAKL